MTVLCCPALSGIANCSTQVFACVTKPIYVAIDVIKQANEKIESLPLLPKLAVRITIGGLIGYCALPILGMIAVIFTINVIGWEKYQQASQGESPKYHGKTPSAFLLCVVVPVVEELFFRGFIQPIVKGSVGFVARCCVDDKTAEKVSAIVAVVFTSTLFGAAHLANSNNPIVSLPQAVSATLGGIILGVMKESGSWADDGSGGCLNALGNWSKGMMTSTAAHMGNNAFVYTLIYLANQGAKQT